MDIEFISRETPKWVIDRIEESWAVLENSETHKIISLPIASLPKDARPGSTIIKHNGKWYVNEADSAARQTRISERFARIKAKNT
jgi:hypothetical protein